MNNAFIIPNLNFNLNVIESFQISWKHVLQIYLAETFLTFKLLYLNLLKIQNIILDNWKLVLLYVTIERIRRNIFKSILGYKCYQAWYHDELFPVTLILHPEWCNSDPEKQTNMVCICLHMAVSPPVIDMQATFHRNIEVRQRVED